jgi:hypothetical protein
MLSLRGADVRDSGRLSPIRVTPLDPSITARRRRDPADRRRGHRAPRRLDAAPDRFPDRCPVCGSLAVREPGMTARHQRILEREGWSRVSARKPIAAIAPPVAGGFEAGRRHLSGNRHQTPNRALSEYARSPSLG